MKMKAIAALLAAGLCALSLGYMAPVAADDSATAQAPADNVGASNPPTQDNNSMDSNNSTAQTPANTSNSNDDAGADTATGDDDY